MKKFFKILTIVILSLIVIIVAAFIWFDKNQGKIAGNIIRGKFAESELSKVYKLDFETLDLKILSGKILIKGFKLTPDSLFYSSDDSLRLKFGMLVDANVPYLSLSGVDMWQLLKNKRLIINGIDINDAKIRLINHLTDAEKQVHREKYVKQKETTSKKDIGLDQITLSHFSISNASAEYYNRLTGKNIFKADSLNLLLSEVKVDPLNPTQALIQKSFGKAEFEVRSIEFRDEKGFYDIDLGKIAIDLAENTLTLNQFKIIPKYNKIQFGWKFKKQTDRFDIVVQEIEISGLDLKRLANSGGIAIRAIKVNGLDMNIYRDKNVPFNFNNFPKFPWQGLANLKTYLEINKVEITNSKLLYEEMVPERQQAGKVALEKMRLLITNVSNDSVYISRNGPMTVRLETKAFNNGDLVLEIIAPTDLKSSNFSFSGSLGAMDMTAFNSITEINERIKIESGKISSLKFEAEANNEYAIGEMTMIYSDLKFDILKQDKEEKNKTHKIGILSWVANTAVKSANPKKQGEAPDIGKMFFERDKNKSVFNYIVKTFISGVAGTVVPGVGKSLKKYEKKAEKAEKKAERKQKKEDRKQKKNQN